MRTVQRSSKNEIVNFYRSQLRKFRNLGIGNKTENNVVVTQQLIDITRWRMEQLVIMKIRP